MARKRSDISTRDILREMSLKAVDINSDWIERKLSIAFNGPCQKQLAMKIFSVLRDDMDDYHAESWLTLFLKADCQQKRLVKYFIWNRSKIIWCIRLSRALNMSEKKKIEDEMMRKGLHSILEELHTQRESTSIMDEGPKMDDRMNEVDLDSLARRTMCQRYKWELPTGSSENMGQLYDEVCVPCLMSEDSYENIKISSMPRWTQLAFENITELNSMESKVYPLALFESHNLLILAPSRARKINIVLLMILQLIGQSWCDDSNGKLKVVYVSPKDTVTEIVRSLSKPLENYNLKVKELSEDKYRVMDEIEEAHVIVTTAEKWDIITRKFEVKRHAELVKLVIVDELYLIHDDRGPFLENVIARMHSQIETTQQSIRLVGFSVPFLNYEDVAHFLRVDIKRGMFHFDDTQQTDPFYQRYVGIRVQDPLLRIWVMNEVCNQRVMSVAENHQVLVYVCSSKETTETARSIKGAAALAKFPLGRLVKEDSSRFRIPNTDSNDLKEFLPCNIAVHHPDMTIADRQLAIDLFVAGHVKVLVSTRALPLGTNTSCHTVIVKGTQIYNPEKEANTELSPVELLQMHSRAYSEVVIVTGHNELEHYLSLMSGKLRIESQFLFKLPDFLMAEIVRGTVQNAREASNWISYTFMYACLISNSMHGLESEVPTELEKYKSDLIHAATTMLVRGNLVTYDSEHFHFTDWGRIASYCGISHITISRYSKILKATMEDIDIFQLFSLSKELKNVVVTLDEQMELAKLLNGIQKHIPTKANLEKPNGKIIILLRARILNLELDGFSLRLTSDADFITQMAGSLLQALIEIALEFGWVQLAEKALNLFKIVSIKLHTFIDQTPKLVLENARVRPITKTLLQFDLQIRSDFIWDDEVHGYREMFWVMLEKDGQIIHHQYFMLKRDFIHVIHHLNFKVAVNEPLSSEYVIRVVSERWPECQSLLPISSRYLLLPLDECKVMMPHVMLDLPVTELKNPLYQSLYQDFEYFNLVQSQAFSALYNESYNILIAAPPGSGKTICAELAILWNDKRGRNSWNRVIYIAPIEALAKKQYANWKDRFEGILDLKVVKLIGETKIDIELFESGNIIISTPEKWDVLSCLNIPLVSEIDLFIVDDLHLLGGHGGHILEVIVLRMKLIARYGNIRFVALSNSVANAWEIGEWIESQRIFNYPICARPVPLDITCQSVEIADFGAMIRTTSSVIAQNEKPAIVFVPTQRHVKQTLVDLFKYSSAVSTEKPFLLPSKKQLEASMLAEINDDILKICLPEGFGFLHEGMNRDDHDMVVKLFKSGYVQVCVLSNFMCWGVPLSAHLVVVVGTQFYDGPVNAQTEYPFVDVLQMMGHAGRPLVDDYGKCIVLCHPFGKEYYEKALSGKIPVESCLNDFIIIQDYFNHEIVNRRVVSREGAEELLKMSFMYTRFIQNISYYGLLHSSHLTLRIEELLVSTLSHLRDNEFLEVDSWMLSPLIFGKLCSEYNVCCDTLMMFLSELEPGITLQDLLEVMCAAFEFQHIPIRYGEEKVIRRLIDLQRFSYANPGDVAYSNAKSYALLQAHLSRSFVDEDLISDQREVVLIAHKLLLAIISVASIWDCFNLTYLAINLLQLVTRRMWEHDSTLMQVPHFNEDFARRLKESKGIETVYEMKDKIQFLCSNMSDLQILDITRFCNKFPDISLLLEVLNIDRVNAGEYINLKITLVRDLEGMTKESLHGINVVDVSYPPIKYEKISWWLFVAQHETNLLLTIQHVCVEEKLEVRLSFAAPTEIGKKLYTLYLMSDSYVGCDKKYDFTVDVM